MTKAKLDKAIQLNDKIDRVSSEINRLEKNEIINAFCSIEWAKVDKTVLEECKKVLIKAFKDDLSTLKKDFQSI